MSSYNDKLGDLEGTKRFFFNRDYDGFTESLNQPYVFHYGEFEIDESDNSKPEFILVNKNKGFIQSIPQKSIRHLLGKFVCRRVNGQVMYQCMIVSKSDRPLDELIDTDGFNFKCSTSTIANTFFLET